MVVGSVGAPLQKYPTNNGSSVGLASKAPVDPHLMPLHIILSMLVALRCPFSRSSSLSCAFAHFVTARDSQLVALVASGLSARVRYMSAQAIDLHKHSVPPSSTLVGDCI